MVMMPAAVPTAAPSAARISARIPDTLNENPVISVKTETKPVPADILPSSQSTPERISVSYRKHGSTMITEARFQPAGATGVEERIMTPRSNISTLYLSVDIGYSMDCSDAR
jgi:hypothetical protein